MENLFDPSEIYDVLIVGAGPSGLTASIFSKNKKLNVLVVEGLLPGGQLKNLYPYKPVYNYPGYSQILAGELSERILKQVWESEISIIENSPVQRIKCLEDRCFQVEGKKLNVKTHTVILACGMGLFEPRRLMVPGEVELEKEGLFYAIEDMTHWKDRRVAVAGGGNSAIDNALLLLQNRACVTLIHKLPGFQAEAASVEKLHSYKPEIMLGWSILEFKRDTDNRIQTVIESVKNKERHLINFDKVLINIGLSPNTDFLLNLPLSLEGKQVKVDSEMQTSIPGIFACGDMVYYPGKVRLIVTAIGEAATAVNSLDNYLKLKKSSKEMVSHG